MTMTMTMTTETTSGVIKNPKTKINEDYDDITFVSNLVSIEILTWLNNATASNPSRFVLGAIHVENGAAYAANTYLLHRYKSPNGFCLKDGQWIITKQGKHLICYRRRSPLQFPNCEFVINGHKWERHVDHAFTYFSHFVAAANRLLPKDGTYQPGDTAFDVNLLRKTWHWDQSTKAMNADYAKWSPIVSRIGISNDNALLCQSWEGSGFAIVMPKIDRS